MSHGSNRVKIFIGSLFFLCSVAQVRAMVVPLGSSGTDGISVIQEVSAALEHDKLLGARILATVELPAELMDCSKKKLSELQYVASMFHCQQELLKLADSVARAWYAINQEYKAHHFSDVLPEELKLRQVEIDEANTKIEHLEQLVCSHYDATLWHRLKRCFYPLFLLLKVDANKEDKYDVCCTEWGVRTGLLLQKVVDRIDALVRDDEALQCYRTYLWEPGIILAPRTIMSKALDDLVRDIEHVSDGSTSPSSPDSSSPLAKRVKKKKHEKDTDNKLPSVCCAGGSSSGGDDELTDCDDPDGVQEFDLSAAFCVSARAPLSKLQSSFVASSVPKVRREEYQYEPRTLIWHGACDKTLRAYVHENHPHDCFFHVVAQHRIPFAMEQYFRPLAQIVDSSCNEKAYKTLLFDGMLIFLKGGCYIGTGEISSPAIRPKLIVHRFFRVDRYRSLPIDFVMPKRGELEREITCHGYTYTVYENDQAVCIVENDSWCKVTYVIFKPKSMGK